MSRNLGFVLYLFVLSQCLAGGFVQVQGQQTTYENSNAACPEKCVASDHSGPYNYQTVDTGEDCIEQSRRIYTDGCTGFFLYDSCNYQYLPSNDSPLFTWESCCQHESQSTDPDQAAASNRFLQVSDAKSYRGR